MTEVNLQVTGEMLHSLENVPGSIGCFKVNYITNHKITLINSKWIKHLNEKINKIITELKENVLLESKDIFFLFGTRD